MSTAQDQVKALVEKLDAIRAEAIALTKPDPMQEVAESLVARIRAEVLRELKTSPLKPASRAGARRKPRSWTTEQKKKILAEIEAARGKWGGVNKVLDKHGIVSANVAQWRQQVK